ncbi:hypothetical protein P9139_20210 [Curtobacterium flaccumfaciens]|nr:hypothetical protein P9139_20210 [Curtobacterium flaccumfaciens]
MAFGRDTSHISVSVHRQAAPEPSAAGYVEQHKHTRFGGTAEATVAGADYRASKYSMTLEVLHTVR